MPFINGEFICKVGRPPMGVTKKVSLTLTNEEWDKLDELKKSSGSASQSDLFRKIIRNVID